MNRMESGIPLPQHSGQDDSVHKVAEAAASFAPPGFRAALGIVSFLGALLFSLQTQGTALNDPLAFGLAAGVAALAYWLAEILLILFVVFLPASLFVVAVIGLIFK